MQRMTLPLEAAVPASCAARPASNGSMPRSTNRSARCVVKPMPRPSRFIQFSQRCATSFASKSPRSASDSASSSASAASSSNGEPLGGGARSRTPCGKALRIAVAVPSRSVGTPSWLPITSPSNAPRARVRSWGSKPPEAVKRPARRPRCAGRPAVRGRRAGLLTASGGLDPQLLTRARGALLGLVIGNQLGVPTERLGTATAIRNAFPQGVRDLAPPPKGSPFDDDAALALLLAESLAERGDFDAHDVAERWVKWMKRDGRGIGLTTQRALRLIERGTEPFEAGRLAHNPRAASNGAVMRCIPVALRYHDNVDRLIRVSTQQAAITHADERCTWGAVAVNLAARELLHGNQHFVEEVLHRLQGAPRPLIEAIRREIGRASCR